MRLLKADTSACERADGVHVVLRARDSERTLTAVTTPLIERGACLTQCPSSDGQKWVASSRSSARLTAQELTLRPTDQLKRGLKNRPERAATSPRPVVRPLPVASQKLDRLAAISDTDRIQKTKGLAGNHRLTPVILGSPTWARTRDLRINSCGFADFARLHETSWDC